MLLAVAVLLFDAPAVSAQGCAPLPAGAVAWWPGEGDATDIVGGFHGTLTENVQFAPGMVGQAFSLDGNASYVQVPDDPALDPVDAASLEAWVWFNQVPSAARRIMTIIGKSGWGRDLDLLGHVDDHFYFYIANGIHVRSTTQIQPWLKAAPARRYLRAAALRHIPVYWAAWSFRPEFPEARVALGEC